MTKSERGSWRTCYSSIFDDLDFRDLTAVEKHVFLTLKLSRLNNSAGIFHFGAGEFHTIAEQTGYSTNKVRNAISRLAETKWVECSDGVMWIRNHLKFEPNFSIRNPNHLISVTTVLHTLPKAQIVHNYCDYYDLDYPFPIPSSIPSEWVGPSRKKEEGIRNKEEGIKKKEEVRPALELFNQFLKDQEGAVWEMIRAGKFDETWAKGEINSMRAWLIADPTRRKEKWMRFISNWLIRGQKDVDKGPKKPYPDHMTKAQEDEHYANKRRDKQTSSFPE